MLLFILAYIGGALTIVSPCILPVLPFVFARAGLPFLKSGLPMLIGMAVTFAAVASLAAVGGGWAVQANEYGRYAALALLAGFGLLMLFPALSDRVTRPVVALGSRLSTQADAQGVSFTGSLLLGVATGLLWAPCAGPVLGLILTGAALNGANTGTTVLLLAYALGAATSLALALVVGGRVFKTMKASLGASEWLRRGAGAVVLATVAAISLGADTSLLARASLSGTDGLEQSLIDSLATKAQLDSGGATNGFGLNIIPVKADIDLPVEGKFPGLNGGGKWVSGGPINAQQLKGKVVLIDFWTFGCINCLHTIPYVEAWAEKYKDQGLVVIGVHAPEFAREKDFANVKKAVADLGLTFPVVQDNDFNIWRAFDNHYWPALYFIDAKGNIRHHHFGEGEYDLSEQVIRQLLTESGQKVTDNSSAEPNGFDVSTMTAMQ
ncbi:MAG: cytochrome c biogenesis protein DipZ [Paracoccaceae bacterium]